MNTYCIFSLSSSCFAFLALISSSVSAFLFLSGLDWECLFDGDLLFDLSGVSLSDSEADKDFLGDFCEWLCLAGEADGEGLRISCEGPAVGDKSSAFGSAGSIFRSYKIAK